MSFFENFPMKMEYDTNYYRIAFCVQLENHIATNKAITLIFLMIVLIVLRGLI